MPFRFLHANFQARVYIIISEEGAKILPVFNVRRNDVTVTIHVDPKGIRLETCLHYPSKEVQFTSWQMIEYPEAFVESAKFALKGFQGYHNEFNASAVNGFVYGGFRAREDTNDWVQFVFNMDGKLTTTQLRQSKVMKILHVVRNYWSMGGQIAHHIVLKSFIPVRDSLKNCKKI